MNFDSVIITTTSIAPGPQGTAETLRVMAGLARNAASWIIFQRFASLFHSSREVDQALRPYYEYTDEEVETLYAPEFNLAHLLEYNKIIGDCDDIATFYAAIFKCMGLQTRFVAMRTKKNDPDFYHVVVETFENNRWKRFDPTVKPSLMQIDYGRMIEYV